MTYTWPSKGKFEANLLLKFTPPSTISGIPTVLNAYAVGTTTKLLLYTDETGTATISNNPIPTGVDPNVAGLDATGNLILFGDVGRFDLVADGVRTTFSFKPSWDDLSAALDQLTTTNLQAL